MSTAEPVKGAVGEFSTENDAVCSSIGAHVPEKDTVSWFWLVVATAVNTSGSTMLSVALNKPAGSAVLCHVPTAGCGSVEAQPASVEAADATMPKVSNEAQIRWCGRSMVWAFTARMAEKMHADAGGWRRA